MTDPDRPPTVRAHRRQFFWQIILPVALVAALTVAAGVAASLGGADRTRLWADVAVIWLLLPVMVLGLILLLALIGLIWLLGRARVELPRLTGRVRLFADRARDGAVRLADQAAEPVLRTGSLLAALRRFLGRK